MKTSPIKATLLAMTLAALAGPSFAQEMPPMPTPTKEHALLDQFAGQWTSECEATAAPGQEPLVCKGTESTRMVGGFWMVATGKADMMGMPVESLMTLGYDPAKKKYVGTFVCSAQDHLWEYEGEFDESGKKLVLTTEGPSMMDPTQKAIYQEVLETVDADHRQFTSSVKGPDGKWQQIVTAKYTRVKK
jgi:hypothetical protein